MTKTKQIGTTSITILITTIMIFAVSSEKVNAGTDTGHGEPQVTIPAWFGQVAEFYSQGEMSDIEFTNNIEFLIKEAILVVPSSANYAEAKSIESELGDMQYKISKLETMMELDLDIRDSTGLDTNPRINDPDFQIPDIYVADEVLDRLDKLETMLETDDDDSITDRLDKLETMLDLGADGVSDDELWIKDTSITDRLDKLETLLEDPDLNVYDPDMNDKLKKLDSMFVTGTDIEDGSLSLKYS